jgi:hypothetical protein
MIRALFAALLLAAAVGGFVYMQSQPTPTVPVAIRLQAVAGSEPLELGQGRYPNPGGEGDFSVRDFQFFVSNIRLVAEAGEFAEVDSYHLARFDSDDGTYVIELGEVQREMYTHLEFGIGVDSVANGTIMSVGDLDPNGRMAWSWDVGYKFVLFEGDLEVAGSRTPLVYHVGFDENYAEVTIPLPATSFDWGEVTLDLCADVLRIFTGSQAVDMTELSDVKFDRADARLLAHNYARMVSLCP